MSEGVKRTVRLGSMSFIDPSGRVRWADCGTEILVHPDSVARFDRLNVVQGVESAPSPVVDDVPEVPKRRPGRPRKAESG